MADSEIANDGSNSTVYILVSGPNGDTDSQTSILFGGGCEADNKFPMSCCPTGTTCVRVVCCARCLTRTVVVWRHLYESDVRAVG
jgi:hypothetical protein